MDRNHKEAFQGLLDQMRAGVDGWSTKFLSKGNVYKAYFVGFTRSSCHFLLPSMLCKQMEMIMEKYCWQKGTNKQRIH